MLEKRPIIGEARDRELLKDSSAFAYKKTDAGELHAHVFLPENMDTNKKLPLVIFFHGGFWEVSTPAQFAPHCLHYAAMNVVAITAETRVNAKHKSTPQDAIEDAQELILAAKKHAYVLGIDPEKIIVVGAAGGSLLALHAAMAEEVKTEGEFDARPAAAIALSALLDINASPETSAKFPDPKIRKTLSPSSMIRKGIAPIHIIHGKADRILSNKPFSSFQFWMKWKKNKVSVQEFDGADHHFYNFNLTKPYYDMCLRSMENFMKDCGFLE